MSVVGAADVPQAIVAREGPHWQLDRVAGAVEGRARYRRNRAGCLEQRCRSLKFQISPDPNPDHYSEIYRAWSLWGVPGTVSARSGGASPPRPSSFSLSGDSAVSDSLR